MGGRDGGQAQVLDQLDMSLGLRFVQTILNQRLGSLINKRFLTTALQTPRVEPDRAPENDGYGSETLHRGDWQLANCPVMCRSDKKNVE